MKTFFRTLYLSFTDPNYYDDVVKADSKFSLKYFLAFYVLLSLVISVYSFLVIQNRIVPKIDGAVDQVVSMYPNDLVLTYDAKENILSTSGVLEPVIIPMIESDFFDTDVKNLLVIDTSAVAEDLSKFQSAILLTDSHMSTLSDISGGFQIYPFDELSAAMNENDLGRELVSMTIDKSFIDSNTPQLKLFIRSLADYFPFILLIGSIAFFYITRIILLLIMSVFNSLVATLLGRNLSYRKVFAIGLHTITVADAITKLSSLVFTYKETSLFSLAFFGISFIALMGVKKTKE